MEPINTPQEIFCLISPVPELSFLPAHIGAEPGRAKEESRDGLFFRPPGFSPYMGREERRVQELDYCLICSLGASETLPIVFLFDLSALLTREIKRIYSA